MDDGIIDNDFPGTMSGQELLQVLNDMPADEISLPIMVRIHDRVIGLCGVCIATLGDHEGHAMMSIMFECADGRQPSPAGSVDALRPGPPPAEPPLSEEEQAAAQALKASKH